MIIKSSLNISEVLWHYLRNLKIITDDNFKHEYFGDVKQLVTVVRNNSDYQWNNYVIYIYTVFIFIYFQDFVNQRYLARITPEKNDILDFEYVWGSRAESEITYRSCLEFMAKVNLPL